MTDLSHMSLRQCQFLDKYELCVTNNYCFIQYNWQRKDAGIRAAVAPVTVENAKWFGMKEEFGGRRDCASLHFVLILRKTVTQTHLHKYNI